MEFIRVGLVLAALTTGSHSLRGIKIKVPKAVTRGENAELRCLYDLEGDQLYSVKWYWNDKEFYRYTPKETPSVKQFKDQRHVGPEVLLAQSDGTRVILEKVDRGISGRYMCEVTADQPSFFTAFQSADLQVVDLPRKDPDITFEKKEGYRPGEYLVANCTQEDSNPAANLTWYVDGEPTRHHHRHTIPDSRRKLYTARSTLRLKIDEVLHAKGRLKVRCVATLYDTYTKVNEKIVELQKKRHKKVHHVARTTELPFGIWEPPQASETQPESTLYFGPLNTGARLLVATPTLVTTTLLMAFVS